jgi:hypothetical protein
MSAGETMTKRRAAQYVGIAGCIVNLECEV